MNVGKKIGILASSVALAGMLLAGCGSGTKQTVQDTSAKGGTSAPKVKIMVGGLEKIIYLPAMLTQRLGYFKQEGLEVELMNEAAGQTAEEALIAGQVDGVVGFYDHTIDIQSKGKKIESVVQFAAVPGEQLVVSDKLKDQIKTVADLKGKKIGVTGLGSSTNFLANYLVTKGGHTTKEYTPVAVGAGKTLIAAMEQGRIDLAVTTEPTISLLKAKHLASTFVDMTTLEGTTQALGGTYPAASLYMRNDFVKEHPEIVQHLANAFVKTLHYIKTHTPEEIADQLPHEYYAGDKAMYIQALKNSIAMFTADGKMPQGGPEKVLEVLSTFHPELKNANIKLEETYTTEFVEKAAKNQ
jgi:NitT/TauT family transport system substrate-binding protein